MLLGREIVVRRIQLPGGALEYAVLGALWDLGPSSARAVLERVGEERGLVYTTIATVLDRLFIKGLVDRKKAGKTFVYRAKVFRETVLKARAREVVEAVLGDDPRPAVAALVDAVEAVDPALIDELERVVAERRNSGASRRGS